MLFFHFINHITIFVILSFVLEIIFFTFPLKKIKLSYHITIFVILSFVLEIIFFTFPLKKIKLSAVTSCYVLTKLFFSFKAFPHLSN